MKTFTLDDTPPVTPAKQYIAKVEIDLPQLNDTRPIHSDIHDTDTICNIPSQLVQHPIVTSNSYDHSTFDGSDISPADHSINAVRSMRELDPITDVANNIDSDVEQTNAINGTNAFHGSNDSSVEDVVATTVTSTHSDQNNADGNDTQTTYFNYNKNHSNEHGFEYDEEYNVPSPTFGPISYTVNTVCDAKIEDDMEYEMRMSKTENQILDSLEFNRFEIQPVLNDSDVFSLTEQEDECVNAGEYGGIDDVPSAPIHNCTHQPELEQDNESDRVSSIEQAAATDNDFDADFSQFASFENATNLVPNVQTEIASNNENVAITAVSTTDSNEIDDDDEFGDFNDFQQSTTFEANTISAVDSHKVPHIEDVKQEFNSILSTMFPNAEPSTSTTSDNRLDGADSFSNDITKQLQTVDEVKTVITNNNWKKSVSKSFLVKALGIDQRNIVRTYFSFIEFSLVANLKFLVTFFFG